MSARESAAAMVLVEEAATEWERAALWATERGAASAQDAERWWAQEWAAMTAREPAVEMARAPVRGWARASVRGTVVALAMVRAQPSERALVAAWAMR